MHSWLYRLGVACGALAAAVVALDAPAVADPAGPLRPSTQSSAVGAPKLPVGACYNQLDDDTGVTIVVQNFEPQYDIYDSEGADDLILEKACKLRRVTVSGTTFDGNGPIESFNVTVYRDNGTATPGNVCRVRHGVPCRWLEAPYVTNADLTWTIDLGAGKRLKVGRYWLNVQVNMDFDSSGEAGWNNRGSVSGDFGVWRNRGDGFETGCVHWARMRDCVQGVDGGDYVFALN